MRQVKSAALLALVWGFLLSALCLNCSGGTVTVAQNEGSALGASNPSPPPYYVDAGMPDEPPGTPTTCAPEQWDCTSREPNCTLQVSSGVLPAGCTCDATRPLTGASCRSYETIACLQVENADATPSEPFVHIQCSCLPISEVRSASGDVSACLAALQTLFPAPPGYLENLKLATTCLGDLAQNEEWQRQQGIVYGCMNIGLTP